MRFEEQQQSKKEEVPIPIPSESDPTDATVGSLEYGIGGAILHAAGSGPEGAHPLPGQVLRHESPHLGREADGSDGPDRSLLLPQTEGSGEDVQGRPEAQRARRRGRGERGLRDAA